MLRLMRGVFVAAAVLGGVALQSAPVEAGVIPGAYDVAYAPVSNVHYRYSAYAPAYYGTPVSYGNGYSASYGGSCCGTAMYAPSASACCSPCGNPCGSACGSSPCGTACGGSPCDVAPSGGATTSSGKLTPTPEPAPARTTPSREEPANSAPPYRREAPTDGFVPRDRTFNDAPPRGNGAPPARGNDGLGTATGAGAAPGAGAPRRPGGGLPTTVEPESDAGFVEPIPRPEDSGTPPSSRGLFDLDDDKSGSPSNDGGTPAPFGRDVEKTPIEGAEHVIPRRAAPIDADAVEDEFQMPMENVGPRLEAVKTSQAVAVKERLPLRPRFSVPTVARAHVRPQGEWSVGAMTRLAGNP